MALTVHIKYDGEIDEMIGRFPCFSFIRESRIPKDDFHQWTVTNDNWGYVDKITYSTQIIFIGKTGYGKSTTLNRLVGKDVFETDDINVCTKDLYTAVFRINRSVPSTLMLSDLPGVGESGTADNLYHKWYKSMINKSDVVVYILRADQRDYTVDEKIFSKFLCGSADKKKVFIAINYADKIEPISRKIGLSAEQCGNLLRKVREVSQIFHISQSDVIYYSAADNINMDILTRKISQKLYMNL